MYSLISTCASAPLYKIDLENLGRQKWLLPDDKSVDGRDINRGTRVNKLTYIMMRFWKMCILGVSEVAIQT